jgi:hypothetical protein
MILLSDSLTLDNYACSLQTTGCSEVIVNIVAVFEVLRCLRGTQTAEHYRHRGETTRYLKQLFRE